MATIGREGGEISLPHSVVGILVASVGALLMRRFVLQPALGMETGKEVSMVLLFFLVGYLAFPVAPRGQAPPPLGSWWRLRMGLIYGGLVSLAVVLPEHFWP